MQAIREHVAHLQLTGSRIVLNGETDAQQSEFDCVIVCVNGHITFPNASSSQAFVQSFVLAPQFNANDTKKSYFVRNSIFRLVGGTVVDATAAAAAAPQPTLQPQVTAPPAAAPIPAATPAPATQNSATTVAKVQQQQPPATPVVAEPPVAKVAPVEKPVKEAPPPAPTKEEKEPPAPPKPDGPKTYASILGVISASPSVSETKVPVASKPAPAPAEKKAENAKAATNNKEKKDKSNVPSLFINNIDENMTKDILFSLFSKFGGVGKIDLFAQKGYAFIEYKEAEGLKAALTAVKNQDPTFVFKGKRLGVEEKSGGKKEKQSQNGQANSQKKKTDGDKKQNKKETTA